MSVLERSELEASPLADLHEIASEAGIDGFRRMRKADLVNAILGESGPPAEAEPKPKAKPKPKPRKKAERGERKSADEDASSDAAGETEERRPRRRRARGEREEKQESTPREEQSEEGVEGVVEVLANGSAFLRVDGPEPSDSDVYISAAQVRRCELVSGDKVSGPVRKPRRSERYPSLVRIDMINGSPADEVSDGVRYEDLPVAWPKERIPIGAKGDSTLEAIELLTPFGGAPVHLSSAAATAARARRCAVWRPRSRRSRASRSSSPSSGCAPRRSRITPTPGSSPPWRWRSPRPRRHRRRRWSGCSTARGAARHAAPMWSS